MTVFNDKGREKSPIVNIYWAGSEAGRNSVFSNTCIFSSVNKFQFLFVPFTKLYIREDVTKGEVNNIQLDGLL